MIFNANTSSHDFYQQRKKQQPKRREKKPSKFATGNCEGTLEEKLAWMRARQAEKRERGQA